MSDVVEDLRLLQEGAQWACGATAATLGEAADEIAQLRAEIVLLEATGAEAADEIERLRHDLTLARLDRDHARAERDAARAEAERLRAALLKVEMEKEITDIEEVGRLIAIGRREGIEAAAKAAENCLHPSAERTAHAAVDDAVSAIRALLTEGGR